MFRERGGSSTFARARVQRARQLHRRLGDPDRLHDRDRPRGDLGAALPDPDLVGVQRRRRRDRHRRAVIALVAVAQRSSAPPAAGASGRWPCSRSPASLLLLAVIVVGVITVVATPTRSPTELDLFDQPEPRGHHLRGGDRDASPSPGSRRRPNLAPDLDFEPDDLRGSSSSAAALVPLLYAGMALVALMAVPVVAGPDGPETALGSTSSRTRCWAWSQASTRPGSPTLMQVAVVADRAGGADLGREHGDARPLAARLHAGDQPPDPELARQARPRASRRRTSRS